MTRNLGQFKALTFDCYGTLIDWETGIWDALQPLIVHNRRDDIPRENALTLFGKHEHALQIARPRALYPDILAHVHQAVAADFGLRSNEQLDEAFGGSVALWPAFADSAESLRYLKRHYKLIILSNVHNAGFAASAKKLGVEFDAVYTAEDIGTYKPNPANFDYMLENLERDFKLLPDDILHTAQSLFHDHVPARALGLCNAWIDRQHLSQGGSTGVTNPVPEKPQSVFTFFSMAEFAAAVRDARDDLKPAAV